MLSTIVAIANNNVIGKDNKLIWHIPEDLKRFKEITMNKTIIMGRKTFESLPKILPGRKHIIITNNKNYNIDSNQVIIKHDLQEIISEYANSKEEVFVIGGGSIYNSLLPYCKKLYLTKIYNDFSGDTFLDINLSNWEKTYSSGIKINSSNNIKYEFINYIKK